MLSTKWVHYIRRFFLNLLFTKPGQTVCSTFSMCNSSRSTRSGIFYSGTWYVVIFSKFENWSRDCVFRDILLRDIVCSDFF